MENRDSAETADRISENLYRVGMKAGSSDLVDVSDVPEAAMKEIAQLMNALARLREAETLLSEASRKYMKLSEQDMRALHYLIVAKRQGEIVTPGMIAAHLRISAASTTKLLNRLERDNHITRRLHPRDRRAFVIEVTPETEASAKQTVGRQQARRFYAAARLTSEERAAVTRFLTDMTEEISLTRADWAGTTVSEG
ncbi:MarR family transcriptional regulator [Leucobacter sp. UCD-THU]|uniref:MarR family winged helix-turn-helix transcriptional regulator n=1 Tax=Leucobacter sp. UCD-THU TaxID=1292023 RepID=UPI000379490C|nr:MarR family transcriptional regulator [Leucobacter sp. UCD-THU]EYT54712.1 MarR family transcriptional regulator [Leucobacter sp. UCD-THU]